MFYYRNSPFLNTFGQFENLGFVIMSTRENICLNARAPYFEITNLAKNLKILLYTRIIVIRHYTLLNQ